MNTGPMICAEDLRKRYGQRVALDGVSFTVNAGEIVGLLGPNRAGKTTTLSFLSGVSLRTPAAPRLPLTILRPRHAWRAGASAWCRNRWRYTPRSPRVKTWCSLDGWRGWPRATL